MKAVIIVTTIFFLGMCFKMFKMNKKNIELDSELDTIQGRIDDIQRTNRKLIRAIKVGPPKKTTELATREHTIILNSTENVVEYEFPYTLKNVKHVELISGIIPKSEYRINEYNNQISSFAITPGSYSDIISMLMAINQLLYVNSTGIILLYDALQRKIIAVAPAGSVLGLSGTNTVAPILGFEPDSYTFPTGTSHDADVITTSLSHYTNLKSSSLSSGKGINNLPASYYTFTNQFVSNAIDANWEYLYGTDRVNMKLQMYVDIMMDEVTYWDGTHRLSRVYIPEEKEETEYESYGRPILRSLNQEYIDLDKLTFRLHSVVSETNRHDYNLNGLNYSLQIQITTVDKHLL